MATPISGAISLSQVNTELGLSSTAAISFNDTLFRQLSNQLSGVATLGDARAAASVNTSTTNLNIFSTLFASNATVTSYKVLIRSTANVNATSGNTALTVGQFATGSTIVINNYGGVRAYGGAGGTSGVGTAGGDAINANYANQTVTINNQTGAVIYGGGGGGGKGGTGGTGGGGVYSSIEYYYNISSSFFQYEYNEEGGTSTGQWFGNYIGSTSGEVTYLNGYYRGSFVQQISQYSLYYIGASVNTYTSGGAGGAGGSGGRGQGADGANASGSAGSAGSAGGTNAGAGGTGGTGGAGALYGAAGSTGSTGSTGASGNNGGGAAGSTGSAGGAAGRYLVKGANSVTLNNSGTVAGGLA